MESILVTGGAGYIGSHACKALFKNNFLPIAYDNLSRGHLSSVKWGPFEWGDINDFPRLCEVLKRYKPIAVLHFAALAYVGESVAQPDSYYRNNVMGSLNLLAAMKNQDVNNIVFSSSCAVYGSPDVVPIKEDTPKSPSNPYGNTKLFIEKILHDYDRAYNLRSISLRYFNACGADPEGEIGEDHDPETHLIPRVFMAATGNIEQLEVFGDDYPTADGTCVRDYIHVSDLAHAHVLALNNLLKTQTTQAFNLGIGRGFSVKEIIQTVKNVTGISEIPIRIAGRRPGDPPALIADPGRAEKHLEFCPQYTDISEMVQTGWQWMSRHK